MKKFTSATATRRFGLVLLLVIASVGVAKAQLQRTLHLRIECGRCVTTVPVHTGEDIGPGLLRRIERDLEPCFGKGWLKKP